MDWDNAGIQCLDIMLACGDVWLYGNVQSKAWKKYYCDLSLAIACLAFVPGGIDVFGHHIEAIQTILD